MNIIESDKKSILCNLDVFIQFKSIFEMILDGDLNDAGKNLNPKIFLVQDSHGSEFMEFFQQEIIGNFDIHEIMSKGQIANIPHIFDEPELEQPKKGEELGKKEGENSNSKTTQKKILFINEPQFSLPEDKENLIKSINGIAHHVKQKANFFIILRLLDEKIPQELVKLLDFQFRIPYPTRMQRIEVFEQLLEELSIHTVDITHLADLTEEKWNILDLTRLVNAAYIQWKILNYVEFKSNIDNQNQKETTQEEPSKEKSNRDVNPIYKIPLTAEIFMNLIQNNQIHPLSYYKSYKTLDNQSSDQEVEFKLASIEPFTAHPTPMVAPLEGWGLTELNNFTSSQLYQYAASNNFEELTVILEKLDQAKKLDEVDRKILADYAFILKDSPNRALLKLTNAKKTIDRIQKIANR